MRRLLPIAATLVFVAAARGQNPTCNAATPAICGAGLPQSDVQIKPQAVPTSTTKVASTDASILQVTVTNTTAGALTFTLADQQASPVSVLSAVSIAANTTYVIVFPQGYWCPGGFTVSGSGSGLNYQVRFRL